MAYLVDDRNQPIDAPIRAVVPARARWLQGRDLRLVDYAPVAKPTPAALAAWHPPGTHCPWCGASLAYVQSGWIEQIPFWWCGNPACGHVLNTWNGPPPTTDAEE